MLGVPASWVYSQTRAGRIPTVKLGRYYRYRREAIEVWIAEREAGGGLMLRAFPPPRYGSASTPKGRPVRRPLGSNRPGDVRASRTPAPEGEAPDASS